jgi:Ca-activated chloride channel family protein
MRKDQTMRVRHLALAVAAAAVWLVGVRLDGQEEFRFRSGVELVNVAATVTDRTGRFVPGLRQSDFLVYDDDQLVDVSHFSAERSAVSLGLVVDTSGSMAGEKIANARAAIDRFLDRLVYPDDEVFILAFADQPDLVRDWTPSREAAGASLRRLRARGGTAMYDAIADAVPRAQNGRNRKKAVILISDGNDSDSMATAAAVRRAIRETEVMVYAIGIDGARESRFRMGTPRPPTIPFPIPGRRRPRWPTLQQLPPGFGAGGGGGRLNVAALRDLTESSGGRTEVVRSSRDLDRATASIADELSQQYFMGYSSPGHADGRWHSIRVEVRDPSLRVRARRGYTAAS